jgi:cell division protein ZapA
VSAPSIKVEIYNQTYNIRSDGDNEYIHRLAEYVDAKMRDVTSGTYTVDSHKVAILAALHIADELHQLRSQQEELDSQLAQRSADCTEELNQLFKNKVVADLEFNSEQ